MDIKTKLEDEELFQADIKEDKASITTRIIKLHQYEIFTVEDYINCDIDLIFKNPDARNYCKLLQNLLKTKYKGAPLVVDNLLTKEHKVNSRDFAAVYFKLDNDELNIPNLWVNLKDIEALGIKYQFCASRSAFRIIAMKMKENNDLYIPSSDSNCKKNKQDYYTITPIEVIKGMYEEGFDNRLVRFYIDYYNKKEQEKTQEQIMDELISLAAQKKKIEDKIGLLAEQYLTLEREKNKEQAYRNVK